MNVMNRRFLRLPVLMALIMWQGLTPAGRGAAPEKPSTAVDFGRQILPILSDNCFACHGPDDKQRKAGLRLDREEDAFKPAKSGDLAIVPGKVSESTLIARITATNPDDVMPPPETGKKLTPVQIDLLKRWIEQGAPWQRHWAFQKPQRPPLPANKDASWARNEIDNFVQARLEKDGLNHSPEADKSTLIRRVTLDVTGLPPSAEEVDAFLADSSPQAYTMLVDRLLNSPRYGEQMARYWLDAARYADSHGYHIDSERSLWKYRDWVINAYNDNKPFDKFTIEQLAGDLLPKPTLEQKIGSGYVRCNMSTGEGGAIVDEYQAKYTFDRVETTGTIWLGLTLLCSRCHTHKYDPIQHKEYYGLYAFFNNLDESVMDGNRPNPEPFIQVPGPDQTTRLEDLKNFLTEGRKTIEAPMPELDKAQEAWEGRWRSKLSDHWSVLNPTSFKAESEAESKTLEDKSILVQGPNPPKDVHTLRIPIEAGSTLAALRLEALPDDSLPQKSSARADDGSFRLSEIEAAFVTRNAEGQPLKTNQLKFSKAVADLSREGHDAARAIDGKEDTGWQPDAGALTTSHLALFLFDNPAKAEPGSELVVRMKYQASVNKRAIGRFRLAVASDPELVQVLTPPRINPWRVLGPFKSGGLKPGFDTAFEPESKVELGKKFEGVREEIKWQEKGEIQDGKDHLLVNELHGVHGVYYLYRTMILPAARQVELSLRADDLFKLWVNGQPVLQSGAQDKGKEGSAKIMVDLRQGENKLLVKVVNHQGACYFNFNQSLNAKDSVPADIAPLFATGKPFTGDDAKRIRNYFRRVNSPEFKTVYDNVEKWAEEESGINKTIPTTIIAKEREKVRETHLLMRGEYDKPGELVTASVPAVLNPFPADAPTNRLGLAEWLMDPAQPLTARVNVNRLWQQFFGVGLVKTAEDFGVQGEHPSHPQLLDWLATEFIQSGWDVKHMQKLILTSATYRQSSKTTPAQFEKDPENRLLARGPRFRVDGEVLRDTALYLGGLLVENQGGHSVKPFEPPGLWEAVSFNNSQKYVPDQGAGQYRRSLYTYWKRQSPPPNMLLFDAPTREFCVVRRTRTNTPLQALALMNDPQYVEASRAFGKRIVRDGGASPADRVRFAFRLATSRNPSAEETKILVDAFQAQMNEFRQHPDQAEKLLSVGGFKAGDSVDAAELAAWTTVASMIMNLDESVTKG